MDLTRLDDQIDVVVGHQRSEALRDAAQFEFQRNLPGLSCRRNASGPRGEDLTTGAGALSLT